MGYWPGANDCICCRAGRSRKYNERQKFCGPTARYREYVHVHSPVCVESIESVWPVIDQYSIVVSSLANIKRDRCEMLKRPSILSALCFACVTITANAQSHSEEVLREGGSTGDWPTTLPDNIEARSTREFAPDDTVERSTRRYPPDDTVERSTRRFPADDIVERSTRQHSSDDVSERSTRRYPPEDTVERSAARTSADNRP